jgi:sister chromatid cohesion protein PDS5
MAPSRRSKQASDEVDPVDESASGLPALQFHQPISWTAGKPIAEAELIKRLQALYNEIARKEQEDIDVESLRPKAADLVSERLLKHRNHGVQAWTACCIVEVLRLFAPDAPYTPKQMKVCLRVSSYYSFAAHFVRCFSSS